MKSLVKREIVLYGLALSLAWVIRFAYLGRVPLTDSEASLALQALGLARGQEVLLNPHPAYLLLSGALMFLFGAGDAAARFWPALVGGLAALSPVFFRRYLGRRAAIWLAFFLAFDPGLLVVSRQAGGTPFAVTFLLFALGLWLARRPVWAGVALSLALLGGPQVWPGLLVLSLSVWVVGLRGTNGPAAQLEGDGQPEIAPDQPVWNTLLRSALAALLLVGTLFFFFPRGLSAMAASLPAYLGAWQTSSGLNMGLLLAGLGFYEGLALFFGVLGALLGRKQPVDRFLSIWALAALALAVLPPGRTTAGLLWVIVPLLALAARQVAALLRMPSADRLPVFGQAVLATAIIGFILLDLLSITNLIRTQQMYTPQLLALGGAVLLLVATSLLVAWGWSARVAGYGLLFSLLAILIVFGISAAWNGAGLSGRRVAEILRNEPQFVDADLLKSTVQRIERLNLNGSNEIDAAVVGLNSPALQWVLRDVKNVSYVAFLPSTAAPALVITPDKPDLGLAAEYRGQTFTWGVQPIWGATPAYAWLRWLYFREIPLQKPLLVLWARTDLFPDNTSGETGSPDTGSGSGIQ